MCTKGTRIWPKAMHFLVATERRHMPKVATLINDFVADDGDKSRLGLTWLGVIKLIFKFYKSF